MKLRRVMSVRRTIMKLRRVMSIRRIVIKLGRVVFVHGEQTQSRLLGKTHQSNLAPNPNPTWLGAVAARARVW